MQLKRRNRLTLMSIGGISSLRDWFPGYRLHEISCGATLWRQRSVVIVLCGFVDDDPF